MLPNELVAFLDANKEKIIIIKLIILNETKSKKRFFLKKNPFMVLTAPPPIKIYKLHRIYVTIFFN